MFSIEKTGLVAIGCVDISNSLIPDNSLEKINKIISMEDMQREHILKALENTGWKIHNKDGAAALLDMNPSTLQSKMRKLGIVKTISQKNS